jgi:Ribbon-helix-helix protein, copG family
MERISISVAPPQMSWLKHEAKRLGVTIGELLRRLIDQVRDGK